MTGHLGHGKVIEAITEDIRSREPDETLRNETLKIKPKFLEEEEEETRKREREF